MGAFQSFVNRSRSDACIYRYAYLETSSLASLCELAEDILGALLGSRITSIAFEGFPKTSFGVVLIELCHKAHQTS